jgi:hypothetical protein
MAWRATRTAWGCSSRTRTWYGWLRVPPISAVAWSFWQSFLFFVYVIVDVAIECICVCIVDGYVGYNA